MDESILRNPDGTWKYTNRLVDTKSLYLLQHAHDPIDWYYFGDEAIEKAKIESKPIFISIGYYSCYWCHVMAREIFCDPEIGEILNKYFINIKIDREEHTDLDKIYMTARQIITGESGWPNNIFLTHDLKPFFATGTLIKQHNKINFKELLLRLNEWWTTRHSDLLNNANNITTLIHLQLDKIPSIAANDIDLDERIIDKLSDQLAMHFDIQYGGFFGAPKFPNESYLYFLLTASENPQDFFMVLHSLNKIAASGLYDHLAGGFHRYTTDSSWHLPHFEKMLYNQSLLSNCYLSAYLITGNDYYKYILDSTLKFVQSSLQNNEGGFYSSIDAETDHTQGKYYTWDKVEIRSILTSKKAEEFFSYYDIEVLPAAHKDSIVTKGVLFCHNNNIQHHYIQLKSSLDKLLAIRTQRTAPHIDTKVITAWHSMMTSTYATAGLILNNAQYIKTAKKAAYFLIEHCLDDQNKLLRIVDNKSINAFAEDYAYAIQALLAVYEATADQQWFQKALAILDVCNKQFLGEDGSYFYTSNHDTSLISIREAHDVTIPSANSIMLLNFLKICEITEDKIWLGHANKLIHSFAQEIILQPMRFPHFLTAISHKLLLEIAFKHVKLVNIDAPTNIKTKQIINLILSFEIDKNYYIYLHDENDTSNNSTKLVIEGSSYLKVDEITYSKNNKQNDSNFYKEHFNILAKISFTEIEKINSIERLDITLYYQLCYLDKCLNKEKLYQKIFIEVRNHLLNDNG